MSQSNTGTLVVLMLGGQRSAWDNLNAGNDLLTVRTHSGLQRAVCVCGATLPQTGQRAHADPCSSQHENLLVDLILWLMSVLYIGHNACSIM